MTSGDAGALVVDTHSAVWYLQRDERLSRRAETEIDRALAEGHLIHVPSICLVELVYLAESVGLVYSCRELALAERRS